MGTKIIVSHYLNQGLVFGKVKILQTAKKDESFYFPGAVNQKKVKTKGDIS